MEPVKQVLMMNMLNLSACLTDGDVGLPLLTEAVAFILQEDIGGHDQGPEVLNGSGAHDQILVETEEFLGVSKENLDLPTSGNVDQEGFGVGGEITGSPIAGCRMRGIERSADDDDLAAVEFAHAGGKDVDVDLSWLVLFLARPRQQGVVGSAETGGIVRQLLPPPAFRIGSVFKAQEAIVLETAGDEKATLACNGRRKAR